MEDVYKQIIGFIDELNESMSLLAVSIDKHMIEKNFIPHKSAGEQISWKISHKINRPKGWRLSYLTRLFVPTDQSNDTSEDSILYQIILETISYFPFPCILCAKMKHEPSDANVVFNKVWNTSGLNALSKKDSEWKSFRKEDGWCIAEPSFSSPIKCVKGYFLNLFDIDEPQKVYDNIIFPLTSDADSIYLSKVLTVQKYDFPGLA